MNAASVLLAAIAFLTGAIVALQPGINGLLSRRLEHPIQASVVSFSVGWLAMVASCLLLRQRLPVPSMLAGAPWWLWVGGGVIGSLFVTTALIVAPRIGAAWWVALIVAGQMATSLALDHYGVLGFARNELSAGRGLGAALVVAGVVMIARG
jgi:transporter family-2 protein